ncbi:MAG: hypothetical protein KDK71_05430 [Chlamydiia bacterium]|nr:hypothetical protein [Chlamydiia bacterium]
MRRTLYFYSRRFNGGIREGALLRLEKDNGRIGWGEIAPLPGFSNETLDEAVKNIIEDEEPIYPSAKWGLASAMMDLLDPVRVDKISIRTLEKEKVKIGHLSLQDAIAKVEKTVCTGVDMNEQWDLESALAFAKQFPKLDYFEEPLKRGEAKTDFPYPVALDESLRTNHPHDYPKIKMHVIKPMLQGYPLPKKIKGVDFILSSSYESELGIYQLAKLAKRLKLPEKPMGLGTCHLFEEPLFEEEITMRKGHLFFPKTWTLKMDKVQVILDESL